MEGSETIFSSLPSSSQNATTTLPAPGRLRLGQPLTAVPALPAGEAPPPAGMRREGRAGWGEGGVE